MNEHVPLKDGLRVTLCAELAGIDRRTYTGELYWSSLGAWYLLHDCPLYPGARPTDQNKRVSRWPWSWHVGGQDYAGMLDRPCELRVADDQSLNAPPGAKF